MPHLEIDDTDSLFEQFEKLWTLEACGAESIKRLLNTFALKNEGEISYDSAELKDLIGNLVEIDIERWWMKWETLITKRSPDTTAEEFLQLFAQRATLENYLSVLPALPKDDGFWTRLIESEISVRDRLGDQIGAAYFNTRFSMQKVLPKPIHPVVLRCELDGESPNTNSPVFPVRGCTLVGRQRSYDSTPRLVAENGDGNRIVIAAHDEREISREQLTIQLLCPGVAIVRNVSQKAKFAVSPNHVLDVQESSIVELPFTVKLHGRKLRIYREFES
jgi:hypothetical protein